MIDSAPDVQRGGTLPGLPDKHFIGGAWRHSVGGGMMESFDPGRATPACSVRGRQRGRCDRGRSIGQGAGEGEWKRALAARAGPNPFEGRGPHPGER